MYVYMYICIHIRVCTLFHKIVLNSQFIKSNQVASRVLRSFVSLIIISQKSAVYGSHTVNTVASCSAKSFIRLMTISQKSAVHWSYIVNLVASRCFRNLIRYRDSAAMNNNLCGQCLKRQLYVDFVL